MSASRDTGISTLLPSWHEGATRDSLLRFLEHADSVPPEHRVAVFDNDGTLWCEKPMYAQADFFIAELRDAAAARPALGERPEYAALLNDVGGALGEFGLPRIAQALVELFNGMPPEEYERRSREFIMTRLHKSGRTYSQMIYTPMLELMQALRSRGFATFIVSGGGVEFVRAISRELYGVSPEGVVGSAVTYELQEEKGRSVLLRTATLLGGPNEGAEKVSNIQHHLGRRPIFAAGNSAGDSEMLDYALASEGPSLALFVDHDDGAREYAYVSEAGSFATAERILDIGRRSDWTIASMKDDWKIIF